jgi:hypothetical protein
MATLPEVESFLKQMRVKMSIWQIRFLDERGKNLDAIGRLEIPPKQREKIIEELKAVDYSEGPFMDKMHDWGEMWVFGKWFKAIEIYIKITLGTEKDPVICISFHPAEHPMNYPLKKENK